MRLRWAVVICIAILSFVGGGWLARVTGPQAHAPRGPEREMFERALEAIANDHVDGRPEDFLYTDATNGIISGLGDPYAELLQGENYRRYNEQMSGTRLGLRLRLREHQGATGISGSTLDALGTDVGIGPLDEIVAVDGRSTEGWTPADAARALAGNAGTFVTLTVRPFGSTTTVVRRVARTAVHVPAVSSGVMLRDGVGYVALHASTETAARELRDALLVLRTRGMRRLVLDLRQNPGGLIPQAVEIAELFLDPSDTIAIARARTPAQSRTHVARTRQPWPAMPVVLLVNRQTASAAEVIAGALQDHDRAAVVGLPTYGKGVIQTTYPLGEEVAVKFTTARWYTPSGRSIQRQSASVDSTAIFHSSAGRPLPAGRGIVPDIPVRPAPGSGTDRALVDAMGGDLGLYRATVSAYVRDLRREGTVGRSRLEPTAAMRTALWRRMQRAGVRVDRTRFEQAAPNVHRDLGYEITRQVLGEEAEIRDRLSDDRQLQAATALLRRAPTQAALLRALGAAPAR